MVTEADKFICANMVKEMFKKSHFSICDFDKCLALMELPRPQCYDQLSKYHCIDYSKMPIGMQDQILGLVLESLTRINPAQLIDQAFKNAHTETAFKMLEIVAK